MKVELMEITKDAEIKIAEYAGICYDSKVTDPIRLVRRLKADNHLATFRFAFATFKISGVSRACAMQHLRHKFLDFLMRSQRYVKENTFDYVIPESMKDNKTYHRSMYQAKDAYNKLIQDGVRAEDARMVLPNSCETEYFVTGNFQAWYDFLYGKAGRLQKAAQWEIRAVATEIENILSINSPNIFGVNNDTPSN